MSASQDVLAERTRQMTVEGWSAEHDDAHVAGELGRAAAAYVLWGEEGARRRGEPPPADWPFAPAWWKPSGDRRRDLVKAGALILAEIERLDRAALATERGE